MDTMVGKVDAAAIMADMDAAKAQVQKTLEAGYKEKKGI